MPWWRHQMSTFSALLDFVRGIHRWQKPVTWNFDVFFDESLKKWLSKQWRRWWFETPSRSLWRHNNGMTLECWSSSCHNGENNHKRHNGANSHSRHNGADSHRRHNGSDSRLPIMTSNMRVSLSSNNWHDANLTKYNGNDDNNPNNNAKHNFLLNLYQSYKYKYPKKQKVCKDRTVILP